MQLCDERLVTLKEVSDRFPNWVTSVHSNIALTKKEKASFPMSHRCHGDIQLCLKGFCKLCDTILTRHNSMYITPVLINSDVNENIFSQH